MRLTVGRSVKESVGWFVMAERLAGVHAKAPNARPISDEAAALPASTLSPDQFDYLPRQPSFFMHDCKTRHCC
jgi:hypothetical protein